MQKVKDAIQLSGWSATKKSMAELLIPANQHELRHLYGSLSCGVRGHTKQVRAELMDTSTSMLDEIYKVYHPSRWKALGTREQVLAHIDAVYK